MKWSWFKKTKKKKCREKILFNNLTAQTGRKTPWCHIQIMKAMTNGAALIKKFEAVHLHMLLPSCKDHPELVVDDDDAARAEVTSDPLLLLLLLLLELAELAVVVVVVPVGVGAVVASAPAEVLPVETDAIT